MHVLGTPLYTILGNNSFPHMSIITGHYTYLQDLLQLELHKPVSSTLSWPRCPTTIQVEGLRQYLSYHPDQTFAAFICASLYNGFHVGFDCLSIHLRSASHNHPSSVANPAVVKTHIAKEVAAGRLVGPIADAIISQVQVSPNGE